MSDPEFTLPPALSPGDRVAIVATSSGAAAAFPHVYELGLERIREVFDLEPVEYPTATADQEYLEANPDVRAAAIEEAFRDPDIAGVITTLGGDDSVRYLEYLDPEVLSDHPTRFFGYSDNTALAAYLWELGIVSFQGPSVMTEFAMQGGMFEYTIEYTRRALFEEEIGEIKPADCFTDHDLEWADPENLDRRRETEPSDGWRWIRGGEPVSDSDASESDDAAAVTGRTWGGCLSVLDQVLAADVAVPDPADVDGGVFLLETSEVLPEPRYARQVLRCLGVRGLLERFDAAIVGRAKARSPTREPSAEERREYRDALRETIADEIARYNPDAPVVFDVEFGHCSPTVPAPVGAMATVDPAEERIVFHGA